MGKYLRILLSALVFWAQGSFSHAVEGKKPGTTEKPGTVVKEDYKQVKTEDEDMDKEVAAHLEMLKVMDMLDQLDLMKDMDMMDGGMKNEMDHHNTADGFCHGYLSGAFPCPWRQRHTSGKIGMGLTERY